MTKKGKKHKFLKSSDKDNVGRNITESDYIVQEFPITDDENNKTVLNTI